MSSTGTGPCVVVVTVDAPAEVMPDLLAHARYGLGVFEEFEGFLRGALHLDDGGTRLLQYLVWRSEAEHLACMHDPRWDELESTRRFMDIVNSDGATMEVRTMRIVEERDAS